MYGLTQYVTFPTHYKGNFLDLIMNQSATNLKLHNINRNHLCQAIVLLLEITALQRLELKLKVLKKETGGMWMLMNF